MEARGGEVGCCDLRAQAGAGLAQGASVPQPSRDARLPPHCSDRSEPRPRRSRGLRSKLAPTRPHDHIEPLPSSQRTTPNRARRRRSEAVCAILERRLPLTNTPARLTAALSDRYRLERELGQGGMATVYLAEDLRHGRKVAIKVLHPELSAVIGGERFLAEIKVTANLQHPHILGLIDSGEADGLLYYVMPYVAGESLRARLIRERQLPVEEALRLSREVASALDYAHRQGVVHRDIKPENTLLQDGAALVADFGIALAVHQAGGSRMTQTGMSLGTPAYMSPEQAMGEREIGARSDVYALGAMTYEMLAGEPPFTGPNSQAIVAKVLTEQPPPLRPKRPTVPPAAEAAIMTALQKLPADRWGSAREFSDALTGAGSRSGTTAYSPDGGRAASRRRDAARRSCGPAGYWRALPPPSPPGR